MSDPATPKRPRKSKQTGVFAATTLTKLNIPNSIIEEMQRQADADMLPLDIYLIRQIAGKNTPTVQ
jgi:hypothetical protein